MWWWIPHYFTIVKAHSALKEMVSSNEWKIYSNILTCINPEELVYVYILFNLRALAMALLPLGGHHLLKGS